MRGLIGASAAWVVASFCWGSALGSWVGAMARGSSNASQGVRIFSMLKILRFLRNPWGFVAVFVGGLSRPWPGDMGSRAKNAFPSGVSWREVPGWGAGKLHGSLPVTANI